MSTSYNTDDQESIHKEKNQKQQSNNGFILSQQWLQLEQKKQQPDKEFQNEYSKCMTQPSPHLESDSDDCLTSEQLCEKETNRANVQDCENLDQAVYVPVKQWFMCEQIAASNVYYKAYIKKITKTEFKVFFPPAAREDEGINQWIKRSSSRIWRLSERQKYWKSLQYCGKRGAWQPKLEAFEDSNNHPEGGAHCVLRASNHPKGGAQPILRASNNSEGANNSPEEGARPMLGASSNPEGANNICEVTNNNPEGGRRMLRASNISEGKNNNNQRGRRMLRVGRPKGGRGGGRGGQDQHSFKSDKSNNTEVTHSNCTHFNKSGSQPVAINQSYQQSGQQAAGIYDVKQINYSTYGNIESQRIIEELEALEKKQWIQGDEDVLFSQKKQPYQRDGQFELMKWFKLHFGIRVAQGAILQTQEDEECLEFGQLSTKYITSQFKLNSQQECEQQNSLIQSQTQQVQNQFQGTLKEQEEDKQQQMKQYSQAEQSNVFQDSSLSLEKKLYCRKDCDQHVWKEENYSNYSNLNDESLLECRSLRNNHDLNNKKTKGLRELQGLSLWSWDKRGRTSIGDSQPKLTCNKTNHLSINSQDDKVAHSVFNQDIEKDCFKNFEEDVTQTQNKQLETEECVRQNCNYQTQINNERKYNKFENVSNRYDDECVAQPSQGQGQECSLDKKTSGKIFEMKRKINEDKQGQKITKKRQNNRNRCNHFQKLVIEDEDLESCGSEDNDNQFSDKECTKRLKPSSDARKKSSVRSVNDNNNNNLESRCTSSKLPEIFVSTTIIHNTGNQELQNVGKNVVNQNCENSQNQILISQIDTFIDGQQQKSANQGLSTVVTTQCRYQ